MENITVNKNVPRRNFFIRIFSSSWINKSILVEIIALWFVILFLYTGIAKLLDFYVFKAQLSESPVLEPVAPLIAWGLPITEFVISLLLFFYRYRLYGLYATFIIMILFTGYVTAVLTTSVELPCSCGGIIEEMSWPAHLLFNGIMVLLTFAAIQMQKQLNRNVQ